MIASDPTSTPHKNVELAEEHLVVDKVDHTSTIRVSTRTVEHDVEVDEMLRSVLAEVERIPIGRYIDSIPEIEERDGLMVVPIVEEVLVKRLVLKAELHVKMVAKTTPHRETVTLRTQTPTVERLDGSD